MIMHFKSQKERLDYLKGNFNEITPKEVIPQEIEETPLVDASDAVEDVPKPIEKPRKSRKKKEKKDDAVQAE